MTTTMSCPESSVIGRSVRVKHAEAEQRKLKQTVETEPAQLQDNIQTEATTMETEPAHV